MGIERPVICKKCGHKFRCRNGGGFFFLQIRCDKCGKDKFIGIDKISDKIRKEREKELLAFIKSEKLDKKGSIVRTTDDTNSTVGIELDGKVIKKISTNIFSKKNKKLFEDSLRKCKCGGQLKWDAPARCPKCHCTKLKPYGTPVKGGGTEMRITNYD